jgi:hypothetical protein
VAGTVGSFEPAVKRDLISTLRTTKETKLFINLHWMNLGHKTDGAHVNTQEISLK